MKHFLIAIILLLTTNYLQAQTFVKKDIILEAGAGLGIYDTHVIQKSNNTNEKSRAATWVFPVSLEYAVSKRLGIGVAYKFSNFITGKNDTTITNSTIRAHDIALKPSFHIFRKKRLDVYVGGLFGLSLFNYQVNDNLKSSAKGEGTIIALFLGSRLYVSDHFGFTFNYTFNRYNYFNLKLANNIGQTDNLDLDLKRGNVNIGLAYRFN